MGVNIKKIYSYIIQYTSGHNIIFLDLFGLGALLFGITVIINKNPIACLMSLIGLFGMISVYLIFIGLTFIGLSYLIVYIGAVSILFLFILMLINIRTSELQSNNSNSIPLALIILILLNYILFQALPYSIAVLNNYSNKVNSLYLLLSSTDDQYNLDTSVNNIQNNNFNIFYVTSNTWDGNITETAHISSIGNLLYTSHNIWLFIAGIILLLAMVGSIVITIKPTKNV